ncbi:MAG: hypothetical protein ABI142_08295, partial [Bryocella sp.]
DGWRLLIGRDSGIMQMGFGQLWVWGKYVGGVVFMFALLFSGTASHASITVLVEQPYGKLGLVDPGGHTAIYLDHVCAETPLKLRPCHAGELGVVISRYDGIARPGGIGKVDWVAMPLMGYLYAADAASEIPETVDKDQEVALRDVYRHRHLLRLAPDQPDGSAPKGNWYELAGSSYDRTIYGFRAKSTPQQDARLIALMNDSKNKEKYNGFYRNCADFVRSIVNMYYPHALRRNWIADLGVTSPMNVAKDLAHYGKKHPSIELETFVIPQVEGTLPRSHSNTGVMEGMVKRYAIPMTILSPELTAVALVAYVGQGRFQMPKETTVIDLQDRSSKKFLVESTKAYRKSAKSATPEADMKAAH